MKEWDAKALTTQYPKAFEQSLHGADLRTEPGPGQGPGTDQDRNGEVPDRVTMVEHTHIRNCNFCYWMRNALSIPPFP